MTRLDDFRKADGCVDWDAYKKAQVDAGERCYKCGTYIVLGISGRQVLCRECKSLATDDGEVTHSDYIRCPKCKHEWSVWNSEQYDTLTEGEHDIECDECQHEFTIETNVSYSFQSPALIDDEGEDDK